ncbi:GNAT family N-acetyltransferase [Fretibacter rubidus]|uniref:GNAT family N-acetyltransferase n=1 Tax=Fretibacter rubidus TaxID=570162 RepID=UPI00352A13F4
MSIIISHANLDANDIQKLLALHIGQAKQQNMTHTLNISALKRPGIHVFCARDNGATLMGIVAIKSLNSIAGEIKSMRTHPNHLRKGVAAKLMDAVIEFARDQGFKQLYLETHPTPDYAAAVRLYETQGFKYCAAFGEYEETDQSLFMTRALT